MLGLQKNIYGGLGKIIRIIVTFLIVNFAWIFFRMPTLSDAIGVIGRIFDVSLPMNLYLPPSSTITLCIVIGIVLLLTKDVADEFFMNRKLAFSSSSVCVRWISYITVMLIILLIGVFGTDQFIYANF